MTGEPIDIRPRRSLLYMPASNPKALEKARSLPCDGVILDLEDAVAPDAKVAARGQAVEAVAARLYGDREVVVRVNGLDTPWGADDLEAVARAGPDAVLVPKIDSADDVGRYNRALEAAPANTGLWVMIETCRSIFNLAEIASASRGSRLTTMVMGVNDLAKEMRARLTVERDAFIPALSLGVMAARTGGLNILDGVFNGIDDPAGFELQCRQGVRLGFDGKTLIHPVQIDLCNALFSPDAGEVDLARATIAAFAAPENAGKGALRVDGRMVERLHLDEARRILAVAEAIAARTPPGP